MKCTFYEQQLIESDHVREEHDDLEGLHLKIVPLLKFAMEMIAFVQQFDCLMNS